MKKKQLVGIINCTPDSFYEKNRFADREAAIAHGLILEEEGAAVLDIGGLSTRPGSSPLSVVEECQRVVPVIAALSKKTRLPLCIDTYQPEVAEAALDAGASWINDITGFKEPRMRALAYKYQSTCCVMHLYSPPHTFLSPHYPEGVVEAVKSYLKQQTTLLLEEGVVREKIVIDPGIGSGSFGKSPEENLALLKGLRQLASLDFPILIGLSRKSFMQKILQKPPSELLSITLVLNTMALLEGASYLRVHDVAAHHELLILLQRWQEIR